MSGVAGKDEEGAGAEADRPVDGFRGEGRLGSGEVRRWSRAKFARQERACVSRAYQGTLKQAVEGEPQGLGASWVAGRNNNKRKKKGLKNLGQTRRELGGARGHRAEGLYGVSWERSGDFLSSADAAS